MALDYGRTKIGIALADVQARIAAPVATLARINRNEDMRRLRELARQEKVQQIVVGLPLRLDGTQGDMADEVTRFAERVRKQVGVPVELVDERLTSWEAERILEEELGRKLMHQETHLGRKRTSRAARHEIYCRCGGRDGDPAGLSVAAARGEGARIACDFWWYYC